MKKRIKRISVILLTPFAIFLLLAALLYIPPIQNWAVKQVAAYASSATGMDITVGRVSLVFPLDLGIERLRIIQPNDSLPQVRDTVVDARSLVVNVRLLPLFRSRVEIDKLDFSDVSLNTTNFIKSARVKGRIGSLTLQSHGIDLGRQTLRVDQARLADAAVDVALSDTVPEDTSKTPNYWKITLDHLDISKTGVTVHLPGDTLQIGAHLGKLTAQEGHFDLYKNIYRLNSLEWKEGTLDYDNNFKTHTRKGLDTNHISVSDITLGIDSFDYAAPKLALLLRRCSFKEKSGITVSQLSGPVSLDSTSIFLPALQLRTPESQLQAKVDMDFNTFADKRPGQMDVFIAGSIGKQDIVRFMGDMPSDFIHRYPNYPLSLRGKVRGNMRHASFAGLVVKLPTALNLRADGYASNLTSTDRLRSVVNIEAETYDLNFLKALLPQNVRETVFLPHGISFDGKLRADGQRYSSDFILSEGGGRIEGQAFFDLPKTKYRARLNAVNFHIEHFLPGQGLSAFCGGIEADGSGFDFLSNKTTLTARAAVTTFAYDGYDMSGTTLNADVKNGLGHAHLKSENKLLDGIVDINALMSKTKLDAAIICNLKKADLYKLHFVDKPLTAAFSANVTVDSDMKKNHKLKGTLADITVVDSAKTYRPSQHVAMDVFTRTDSTHASISTGDFLLHLDAAGGYEHILHNIDGLMKESRRQLKERYIDQLKLREWLPHLTMYLKTGHDNIFSRSLSKMGYHVGDAFMDIVSSKSTGINGHIDIDSLVASGVRIDTIRLKLISDSMKTDFTGKVRNSKNNPQYVFTALFGGTFYERGLYYGIQVKDAKEKVGLAMGLNAAMENNGIRLSIGGKQTPIIGYKQFKANKDNYIFLRDDRHVSANLQLKADDGMGVQVYTNDSTGALQDMTVALAKFDLAKVLSVIPYMPDITGIMSGDFHVIKTAQELSVSSSVSIDDMTYEKCRMGDISSDFVYMPKGDGTHSVDGSLTCDGREVGNISGSYNSEVKDGNALDATLSLSRTPLALLNGFIPDQIVGLKGYCSGDLSVRGSLSRLDINGNMKMDSAFIASVPYGVELLFSDKSVRVENSHIMFDNFKMYAHNKSPLSLNGYFDFSRIDDMFLSMIIRADNHLLIDSKENMRSEAYGKAYVNFVGQMKGKLPNLSMRGKLDVLGSTDMTYILRDSPLSTDNQLEGLVKFVNFSDTTTVHTVNRPPLEGFDMDLTINIDEGAHVVCALNAEHSNYIDLIGGGNLRMQYSAADNLRLNGRYTLSNGEMKYSLPVIPLKTFTLQDGSYIEFNGDPMNPRLNIKATEQTKATVTDESGSGSRSVLFECGVVITKTLKNMGLQFTIDAPEDQTMSSELQTMSPENRGKIAVTMLTTGMYLSGVNDMKDFSMNSALSSFLNSQINSISGSALRTLDLSFGMENSTIGGNTHTDYSFKFAKRFWNNRLNIVIGGKVSSGAEVENQNNTFFDNVTFEYRLSDTSNKYLRLFYDRDSYDWLEGDVGKYGGGFMYRRKLQHLGEIFGIMKKKKSVDPPTVRRDTVKPDNK